MKRLIEKIKEWFENIPTDKKVLFVVGILVSAFVCITLKIWWCIVPSIFVGFIFSFVSNWEKKADWWKMAAVTLGGLVIQLFQILA